jgi:DNA sulfur modification protein DndD
MHITQLRLRNWRSYRNAIFTFPVPDKAGKRNIILVGAQNGVGKTSFLISLYLGLFGREAMNLIEGFRSRLAIDDKLVSYRRIIESILHRPAREEAEAHCSVSISFVDEDGQQITITRRWMFRANGKVRDLDSQDGEEVSVEVDGRKKLFPNWQEANLRIEELLFPCNVMPCLFFDGEQAQARVEAAGGHALFDAVKTLYGTGILDQLSESLKTYINSERAALQRDLGSVRIGELEQKRLELDRLRDEVRGIQVQLIDFRKAKTDAEETRQRIETQLYSIVGDKAADIEEYSGAIAALQADEVRLQQQLVSGVGAIALPLGLNKVAYGLQVTLRSEQVRERWLLLKDEAAEKASAIVEEVLPCKAAPAVVPPLSDIQASQLRHKLEKALESLWSPPPEDCALGFKFPFLQQSDRVSVISKAERYSTTRSDDLSEVALELQKVTTRLAETKSRFERTRDIQPQLTRLKAELSSALEAARTAASQVANHEHKERGLLQSISDLRGAIGQMESRQEASTPIQRKLDVAQKLRSLTDDAKDRMIPLCKAALEERCTFHFLKMISGEYSRFRARFDQDSEPWLEGPKGQEVLVSSLSGAQKRAFGLAFTLAVADVSNRDAPIVIDTPVGNMDSEYRGRVLSYVAEAAPGQVIFLSHDKEIDAEYVAMIAPKIRKQFLIKFEQIDDGAGASTISEDMYF